MHYAASAGTLWLVEREDETGRGTTEKYVVGWQVAQGGARKAIQSLKKRSCSGPTSMKPELAVLTANLARVGYMDNILDPCAGAGSLLQAAAALSCNTAMCVAADRDGTALEWTVRNFQASDLRSPCAVRADLNDRFWARQSMPFDVMVSDLPYGIRAEIVDSCSNPAQGRDGEENLKRILDGALAMARRVLRGGGRFACWIPQFALVELSSVLSVIKGNESDALELECVLQEGRDGGVQRALAVFCVGGKKSRDGGDAGKVLPGADLKSARRWSRRFCPSNIASPEDKTGSGPTADVWRAAWNGQVLAVRQYLESGGDVNQVDQDSDCTMLQLSAGYGRETVCKLLLKHGANIFASGGRSGSAVHRAARHGHEGVISVILEWEGIQAVQAAAQPDVDGCTAIFYAARYGHVHCLLLLLGSFHMHELLALALERRGSHDLTPLCAAARFGKTRVVEILLAHAADPQGRTGCREHLTPAHLAARWGHAEILEVLGRVDASSLSCVDVHGRSPLDEAKAWKRADCIEALTRRRD